MVILEYRECFENELNIRLVKLFPRYIELKEVTYEYKTTKKGSEFIPNS